MKDKAVAQDEDENHKDGDNDSDHDGEGSRDDDADGNYWVPALYGSAFLQAARPRLDAKGREYVESQCRDVQRCGEMWSPIFPGASMTRRRHFPRCSAAGLGWL